MATTSCITCGMDIWIPDAVYNHLKREGPRKVFYCAAGHQQHFIKQPTPEEQEIKSLKEEVREKQRRIYTLEYSLHECPFPSCDYQGRSARALVNHLRKEHGAKARVKKKEPKLLTAGNEPKKLGRGLN